MIKLKCACKPDEVKLDKVTTYRSSKSECLRVGVCPSCGEYYAINDTWDKFDKYTGIVVSVTKEQAEALVAGG